MHNAQKMSPEWLQSLLERDTPAPKLYAWGLSNVQSHSASSDRPERSSVDSKLLRRQDDSHRRVYILGVGNLGALFASSLASLPSPPPVTLVFHRKELLLSWQQNPGIEIIRGGIVQKHSNFDVELWSEEPPSEGQSREVSDGRIIHNLLVTTKASQALPEVDRVRRYLNANSTVAFAQNGMCKMWPPHGTLYNSARFSEDQSTTHPNWLACVTTHGVTSLGRFKSLHASEADVKVGPVLPNPRTSSSASYLSGLLVQAPHLRGTSVPRDDLWILQLEKLVVNSIINPLTAILRCKNGQLFAGEEGAFLKRLMDQLLNEASGVLRGLVNDPSTDSILQASTGDGMPAETDEVRNDLLERFSQPRLRHMLYDVGHKVRENTSSMLQDVRAGKPTEVDEFNGWLVEMAAYLGKHLEIACHQTLIGLVKNGDVLDTASLSQKFSHLVPVDPVSA
ncbi:hypothetical protein CkaCkLH20_05082 [Colletotrichum karsti]|uniref:2-dehydropantoate 2-reductase n=1 Tax=Colletotrichum karsti TaxID=1095194 RepID=A0A9P6LMC2_9PEZI|nr:uncharacterized protein CkaCkLH20_05082 [Colletotrichum karsti]KAF9877382.1 hypothetical protein CkaCkLH20_05082 [Colletotrichum karsti]